MTTWDIFRNSGGWPVETPAEEAERAAGPRGGTQQDTDNDEEGDRCRGRRGTSG